MILNSPYISGSLTVTGTTVLSGSVTLASGASIAGTSSLATTALTASSVSNLNQNVQITGSLGVTSTITAQTLNVQTVTSSVVYSSGSNIFGNSTSNVQQMTGSVSITGSLTSNGAVLVNGLTGSTNDFQAIRTGGETATLGSNPNIQLYNTTTSKAVMLQMYSGSMQFATFDGSSYTEKMRLTVDGNLGIGTTTISATPTGTGWTYSSKRILEIDSTDTNGNSGIFLRRSDLATGLDLWSDNYFGDAYFDSRWNDAGAKMYFRLRTAGTAFVPLTLSTTEAIFKARYITAATGTSNDIGVWIKGIGSYSTGYASIQSFASDVTYDTNLVLQENGGRVGIGLTNPSIKLHVVAGSGTGTTTAFCIERGGGYGATFFKQYYNSGADWGLIVQSSTNADGVKLVQGATSWASNSDERLKDIIEPISNATDKVNTLRAVVGKYKTDSEDKKRLFLIAQDVQKVFPEAVDIEDTEEAHMSLRYSELIPVLVKAIQEQQTLIESLKARIETLESK